MWCHFILLFWVEFWFLVFFQTDFLVLGWKPVEKQNARDRSFYLFRRDETPTKQGRSHLPAPVTGQCCCSSPSGKLVSTHFFLLALDTCEETMILLHAFLRVTNTAASDGTAPAGHISECTAGISERHYLHRTKLHCPGEAGYLLLCLLHHLTLNQPHHMQEDFWQPGCR